MIKYCLGFLFSGDGTKVLLIKKENPEWQRGLWNGIGGKVKPFETFEKSMIREFEEETSAKGLEWEHFLTMNFESAQVLVYRSFIPEGQTISCFQKTDELISFFEIWELRKLSTVASVKWLVELALETRGCKQDIVVNYLKDEDEE